MMGWLNKLPHCFFRLDRETILKRIRKPKVLPPVSSPEKGDLFVSSFQ